MVECANVGYPGYRSVSKFYTVVIELHAVHAIDFTAYCLGSSETWLSDFISLVSPCGGLDSLDCS